MSLNLKNVRVDIDTNKLLKKYDENMKESQKFLDNTVLKDCAPKVPRRTGELERSGIRGTTLGSGKVVYSEPYARKMYYHPEYNFNKSEHPEACGQWFEETKAVKKKEWISQAKKIAGGKKNV